MPFLKIQEGIIPAKYSIIRNGERLKESLDIIEEVQKEILPKVKAENPTSCLSITKQQVWLCVLK